MTEAADSSPLLDGLTPTPDDVNYPGAHPPEPFDPFEGDARGREKTRLIKWLVYHPQGVPLVRSVQAVMPDCSTERIADRDYSNTDYQFARRFLERTEYAELDYEGDVISASPTPAAFHLTRESKIPSEHRPGFAKDRAESLAAGIWSLNRVKDARLLAKDFITYLDSIHDRRLMLQERHDPNKKLTMPYHTRFNDDHRKKEQWARYNAAWEAADERYDTGTMLTLTTDPKRYDSLLEMVDGLMEAWQELHEAMNQRFGCDTRLDFIRALEFGGSQKSSHVGLPHLHVVVFGVPYIDKNWLNAYWNARHARVTHFSPMRKRGSESWVFSAGQHESKSVAGYLGKYLSKTFESIAEDPEDLRDEVASWTGANYASSELWKLALYWATGRQFWSCSHDLKDDRADPDRLEDVAGLGDTKLERLRDAGIHTLSDVRLADTDEISALEGISEDFAESLKEIVGEPSAFDVYSFEFVGAASWSEMPRSWSSARHYGIAPG